MDKISWITLLQKNSGGISSKRFLSIIGFLTCIGIFIASFITEKSVPEFGEFILISCLSLYGIDIIPNFTKSS